jgi:uncharacterized protein (TIGR03083 family)
VSTLALAYPAVPARAFTETLEHMDRTVFAIGPNDWCNPTPCPAWTVRDLLGHVVSELAWVPPLLAGRTVAEVKGRVAGDRCATPTSRSSWTPRAGRFPPGST